MSGGDKCYEESRSRAVGEVLFLYKEMKQGLPDKVALEQISKERKGASCAATWMRNILGKDTEARLFL